MRGTKRSLNYLKKPEQRNDFLKTLMPFIRGGSHYEPAALLLLGLSSVIIKKIQGLVAQPNV